MADDCEELTRPPKFEERIENYRVVTAKDSTIKISKLHDVGKRSNQQDSFAYSDVDNLETLKKKGMLILVADGMGGLENGAEVSSFVAVEMLKAFDNIQTLDNPSEVLKNMVYEVNEKVNSFLGPEGLGKSGTTLVAAIIKEHKVYWVSVGDSFIFWFHDHELIQLNKLHNYGMELDEMLSRGEISQEEAMNNPSRAALTSYIGAGHIEKMDYNTEPIILEPEDRFMLMSDGVKTIARDDLAFFLNYDVEEAALKIKYEIQAKNKKNQDNYTAIIVEDHYSLERDGKTNG